MATLGETSILANEIATNATWLRAFRFQAGSSFTAQSLYCYVRSSWFAGYKAVFGVYSDSGGPDTLLGQTAEQTSDETAKWLGANLQSSIEITNGSYYWLAYYSKQTALGTYAATSGGSQAGYTSLGSYSPTMPASLGAADTTNSWNSSIYISSELVPESGSTIPIFDHHYRMMRGS